MCLIGIIAALGTFSLVVGAGDRTEEGRAS
jgi:hypothetical protein